MRVLVDAFFCCSQCVSHRLCVYLPQDLPQDFRSERGAGLVFSFSSWPCFRVQYAHRLSIENSSLRAVLPLHNACRLRIILVSSPCELCCSSLGSLPMLLVISSKSNSGCQLPNLVFSLATWGSALGFLKIYFSPFPYLFLKGETPGDWKCLCVLYLVVSLLWKEVYLWPSKISSIGEQKHMYSLYN